MHMDPLSEVFDFPISITDYWILKWNLEKMSCRDDLPLRAMGSMVNCKFISVGSVFMALLYFSPFVSRVDGLPTKPSLISAAEVLHKFSLLSIIVAHFTG